MSRRQPIGTADAVRYASTLRLLADPARLRILMNADDFIHLYCAECNSLTAMCGYYGPDEPPEAERLPHCPTCTDVQLKPCPSCASEVPA